MHMQPRMGRMHAPLEAGRMWMCSACCHSAAELSSDMVAHSCDAPLGQHKTTAGQAQAVPPRHMPMRQQVWAELAAGCSERAV